MIAGGVLPPLLIERVIVVTTVERLAVTVDRVTVMTVGGVLLLLAERVTVMIVGGVLLLLAERLTVMIVGWSTAAAGRASDGNDCGLSTVAATGSMAGTRDSSSRPTIVAIACGTRGARHDSDDGRSRSARSTTADSDDYCLEKALCKLLGAVLELGGPEIGELSEGRVREIVVINGLELGGGGGRVVTLVLTVPVEEVGAGRDVDIPLLMVLELGGLESETVRSDCSDSGVSQDQLELGGGGKNVTLVLTVPVLVPGGGGGCGCGWVLIERLRGSGLTRTRMGRWRQHRDACAHSTYGTTLAAARSV